MRRFFQIGAELDGRSLGSSLKRLSPETSWSRLKHLVRTRRVRVDGTVCLDPGAPVTAGQVLSVATDAHAQPPPRSVRIVHVDRHLVVVDKPPGMVTTRRGLTELSEPGQKPSRYPALDEAVEKLLIAGTGSSLRSADDSSDEHIARPRDSVTGQPVSPVIRVVHRLDRDTSGLMLFALSPDAEIALRDMFARHDIHRTYLAVAHGMVRDALRIESVIVRDRGDGLRGSLRSAGPSHSAEDRTARQAVTHIDVLEQFPTATVVRCRLETGRTHQIRIHLSEMGHRLCGELLYTHGAGETPLPEDSGAPRQALHSAELSFVHPISKAGLSFNSALPPDLEDWLDSLRKGARTD